MVRFFRIAAAVILATVAVGFALALTTRLPGEAATPSGLKRNQAVYLTMRDGNRIAVELWLPGDLKAGQRVPTLMRPTRYWRAPERGLAYRLAWRMGWVDRSRYISNGQALFNRHGYAVLSVDARGSGASFGKRPAETSPAEVLDYCETIDWIVRQPWSNGRVGAYGGSYEATASEMIASCGRPAFRAVSTQVGNFDVLRQMVRPGGVLNRGFMGAWSDYVGSLDAGVFPACHGFIDCLWLRTLAPGPKPVDGPDGKRLLREVLAARRNPPVYAAARSIRFEGDTTGSDRTPFRLTYPAGRLEALKRSGVAYDVRVSWLDTATAEGALQRFETLPNSQRVTLTTWSHIRPQNDVDPFMPTDKPSTLDRDAQYLRQIQFFDRWLKPGGEAKAEKRIIYYTLGTGDGWRTTDRWPPAGLVEQRYVLGAQRYRVDFSANMGATSRWNPFNPDIVYADQAGEDRRRLTWTSAPMTVDTEVTGSPRLTLEVAADAADTAFHAYLEDVAPDGRSTYFAEGVMRASYRATIPADQVPWRVFGPFPAMARATYAPLTPGKMERVEITLFPTSALIRQGHRLRLALAGADRETFERVPSKGGVTWTVSNASSLILPMKPWDGTATPFSAVARY
jgi:predicted acyl esterase